MSLRKSVVWGIWLAGASLQAQTDPGWWSPGLVGSGTPNNYGPLNLGQLMNFADQARIHLNTEASAAGGAGPEIESMVTGWPSNSPTAYTPANLGQLKAIADKFYARLDALGLDYKSQLIMNGYAGGWTGTAGHLRPWNEATPTSTNYTIANIGQAKILFSWDFTVGPDALPDWWEKIHFNGTTGNDPGGDADGDGLTNLQEFQQGTDPQDFWNGQPPVLVKVDGDNQLNAPGGFLSVGLTVEIRNAQGRPFPGGSVAYAVTSGGGTLQLNSSGTPVAALSRSTGGDGQVKVYFRLPSTANNTSTISATFALAGQPTQTVTFSATSGSLGTVQTSSPFNPINMQGEMNADGSQDVTWENNPDSNRPVKIWLMEDNGTWTYYATAPLGATSFHIPPQ